MSDLFLLEHSPFYYSRRVSPAPWLKSFRPLLLFFTPVPAISRLALAHAPVLSRLLIRDPFDRSPRHLWQIPFISSIDLHCLDLFIYSTNIIAVLFIFIVLFYSFVYIHRHTYIYLYIYVYIYIYIYTYTYMHMYTYVILFYLFVLFCAYWSRKEGIEANQDCTIVLYKKIMLGCKMTKVFKVTALKFKS